MIKVAPTTYPKKEVVCFCDECAKEIAREAYDTYFDCDRVKLKLKRLYKKCPFCSEIVAPAHHGNKGLKEAIKWEKHIDIYGQETKDFEAKLPDGDFLVWKQGKIWKARYREYGSDMPIMLGFSSTLTGIKQRCEHSKYWREQVEDIAL